MATIGITSTQTDWMGWMDLQVRYHRLLINEGQVFIRFLSKFGGKKSVKYQEGFLGNLEM